MVGRVIWVASLIVSMQSKCSNIKWFFNLKAVFLGLLGGVGAVFASGELIKN